VWRSPSRREEVARYGRIPWFLDKHLADKAEPLMEVSTYTPGKTVVLYRFKHQAAPKDDSQAM